MPAPARAKETPIEALPLEERIRRRAYELYVERGDQSDSELDDWLQAEEEVLQTQVRIPLKPNGDSARKPIRIPKETDQTVGAISAGAKIDQ
jgi:hypothetical protein